MSKPPPSLRSIGAVLLAIACASPLQSADRETLGAALEQVARKIPIQSPGVSIQIADEETGDVVFERSPDAAQTIASITKLITTATALHYLGPDYKFKTTFWRRGEIRDGALVGSLLVVGGGDPNISGRFYGDDINAVFDRWAEGLLQAGVHRVVGDVLVNAAFFDSVGRHPDWKPDQENAQMFVARYGKPPGEVDKDFSKPGVKLTQREIGSTLLHAWHVNPPDSNCFGCHR